MRISIEQVAEDLQALIRECDGDTLATLYEYTFGNVISAYCIDDENMEIELND